jgi:hypothetical protein
MDDNDLIEISNDIKSMKVDEFSTIAGEVTKMLGGPQCDGDGVQKILEMMGSGGLDVGKMLGAGGLDLSKMMGAGGLDLSKMMGSDFSQILKSAAAVKDVVGI